MIIHRIVFPIALFISLVACSEKPNEASNRTQQNRQPVISEAEKKAAEKEAAAALEVANVKAQTAADEADRAAKETMARTKPAGEN